MWSSTAAIVNGDNVWDHSGYCNYSKFDWSEFEALSLQKELELICSNSHAGSDGMQEKFSRSTTTEDSCYVTGGFHPYQDIEQNGRSLCTKSNSSDHSGDKTLDFDRTRGQHNASDDFNLRISDKTKAYCDLQSPPNCKTSLQTNNVTEGQRIIKKAKTLKEKNVASKDDGVKNPLKKHLTAGGASPSHVKPISGGGTKGKGQPAKNLHAERRRRKRLNERLCMLRSAVPTITKMDRTSILSDTIEYTKQLLSQIRHLHKELQPQAEWPAHLRAYGPYFGSASDQYFADKTIPKFEVHRTDGWHLNIHMACQANPNLLMSTVNTLESFGLEIEHGVFSCFGDFGMQAHCSEMNKGHGNTRPEDIKLALLQKAGYLGKSEQRV
ncbi:hypothetical protein SUGI_0596570 [Cryptomeria japonica]|nr:hypothetical protein SUGI_0596570 [Cryptomeria japonica]